MRQLYRAVVESVFLYGAGVWLPYLSAASLARLDRLQGRAARLILGAPQATTSMAVMRDTGMVPAENLAAREAALIAATRGFSKVDRSHPLRRVVAGGKSTWGEL